MLSARGHALGVLFLGEHFTALYPFRVNNPIFSTLHIGLPEPAGTLFRIVLPKSIQRRLPGSSTIYCRTEAIGLYSQLTAPRIAKLHMKPLHFSPTNAVGFWATIAVSSLQSVNFWTTL